jgi:hypothetical protein
MAMRDVVKIENLRGSNSDVAAKCKMIDSA